jgi:hypothetical protein
MNPSSSSMSSISDSPLFGDGNGTYRVKIVGNCGDIELVF